MPTREDYELNGYGEIEIWEGGGRFGDEKTCKYCRKPIKKGSRIRYKWGEGMSHAKCVRECL